MNLEDSPLLLEGFCCECFNLFQHWDSPTRAVEGGNSQIYWRPYVLFFVNCVVKIIVILRSILQYGRVMFFHCFDLFFTPLMISNISPLSPTYDQCRVFFLKLSWLVMLELLTRNSQFEEECLLSSSYIASVQTSNHLHNPLLSPDEKGFLPLFCPTP